MTAAPEKDSQLLAIGIPCSHISCNLVDFLPFKCQHCQEPFCQEHFKVEAHQCQKYDENQYNRVAPNCPLCNTPIAFRQGEDPNSRMDRHLESECLVVTGKTPSKSKSTPTCARPSCKKVLFSPIRCDSCRQQFCPAHRFPNDHTCKPQSVTAQSNMLSRFEATSKGLASKASAATASAIPAAKKASAVPKPIIKATSAQSASSSTATAGPKLPFAKMKTDSRAKAEHASRLKAMRVRAQKGLLNQEEMAILEAEEAAAKNHKDCVIM